MILKFLQQRVDLIPVSPTVDGPLGSIFGGFGLFSFGGLLSFFGGLWTFYTIVAYVFSIFLLVLYVYASVRKNLYLGLQIQELRDAERLYDERYRGGVRSTRLQDVFNHAASDNPNDWKLAIIEADIILEEALGQKGYLGATLGERLKSISSQQLESLQDAWEAHKIRNQIAHSGADFVLTKRLAQETISRYQRVFTELGVA